MEALVADADVAERRPLREARDMVEFVGEIVEVDPEDTLVAVQQERRRHDRERQRRDREEEPAYSERGKTDDDRRDRTDRAREKEAQ